MNHYQLTLDELQPVSFWADNSQLKNRLNSAYIKFKNKHDIDKVVLYVHHPIQGWCQVYNTRNGYQVINNPLKLDYNALIMAIIHTLTQAEHIPSAKQKQQKRARNLQIERNINAEIQRRTFHIVKPNKK